MSTNSLLFTRPGSHTPASYRSYVSFLITGTVTIIVTFLTLCLMTIPLTCRIIRWLGGQIFFFTIIGSIFILAWTLSLALKLLVTAELFSLS